jgi:hypothetical protein
MEMNRNRSISTLVLVASLLAFSLGVLQACAPAQSINSYGSGSVTLPITMTRVTGILDLGVYTYIDARMECMVVIGNAGVATSCVAKDK